jgi:hypothetical protein
LAFFLINNRKNSQTWWFQCKWEICLTTYKLTLITCYHINSFPIFEFQISLFYSLIYRLKKGRKRQGKIAIFDN